MNTLEAISRRRSIRKFRSTLISDKKLNIILKAATQAPSGKNKQPWKFVLLKGLKRIEMIRIMRSCIEKSKAQGNDIGSSENTTRVMEQAPITIFILNPEGRPPWKKHSAGQMFDDVVDIQSIGAAIQNMLLAAEEIGIGSLWICDIFYAYEDLMRWLGETGELIAAVSLGYRGEHPDARPRKAFGEVVRILQ
jgi:nitroreductase